jgi:hypothetical protein
LQLSSKFKAESSKQGGGAKREKQVFQSSIVNGQSLGHALLCGFAPRNER